VVAVQLVRVGFALGRARDPLARRGEVQDQRVVDGRLVGLLVFGIDAAYSKLAARFLPASLPTCLPSPPERETYADATSYFS
jgi:hypothetical protein